LAPGQVETRVHAAHLLSRAGPPGRGLALLDEIVRSHPERPDALYLLAETLERSGRPQAALPYLDRVRALDPTLPGPHYLEGKIRYGQGDRARAAESMRRFLDLWPYDGDPWSRAARAVIASGASGPIDFPPTLGATRP
jgi:tetratricopeptide (TPR) repeat protein